jgi:hypothetical protein
MADLFYSQTHIVQRADEDAYRRPFPKNPLISLEEITDGFVDRKGPLKDFYGNKKPTNIKLTKVVPRR